MTPCWEKSCLLFGVSKVDGLKLMSSDEVDVDTYGGHVRFGSVKKSDEGRYACDAINDAGSDTGFIQLRVLGKVIIVVIMLINRIKSMEFRQRGPRQPVRQTTHVITYN